MKFRTETQVGHEHVCRVSATPHPEGAGPSVPNFWDLLHMRAQSMRSDYQILHCDQTRSRKIFTWSTTNADARSVSGRNNLLIARQIYISRVVSEIFNVEKSRDLEMGVKGHSRSLRVVSFDRLCMVSY